ncbi:uncharacterized protein LOC132546962, partial [Ylistrum balloti]|uniref:uncharacterized protein LOC132546962 n=1 Tax=Ylistrum balloti TaxID=509963 RepID=UPI00290596E6
YALESPFFLSNSTGNWSEGESYCLEHNGRFVTIDTQGKYDRILDLDNNDILPKNVFIGLSTTSTNCTDYIWSSGKPLVWSKWQVGGVDPEPNHCTTRQCVRLASGYFKTAECKKTFKALCEYVIVKTSSSSTTMATTQIIKTTTLTMAATETSITFSPFSFSSLSSSLETTSPITKTPVDMETSLITTVAEETSTLPMSSSLLYSSTTKSTIGTVTAIEPTTISSTSETSITNVSCIIRNTNVTKLSHGELLEIITQLKAELSVSKNNTSTYRRKRISVYESRPSSMIMGGVALYALESPFFLSNSTGNWSEGESYCLEHNGRFVTIDTQGKYDRILDLDNNDILSTEVFIGLSTTSTNCTDYIWSSGKPLVWSKWKRSKVNPEPNRCTTNQCIRLVSGTFRTTECKHTYKALCEYVVKTPSSSTTMATTQIIKTTTLKMAATETSITFSPFSFSSLPSTLETTSPITKTPVDMETSLITTVAKETSTNPISASLLYSSTTKSTIGTATAMELTTFSSTSATSIVNVTCIIRKTNVTKLSHGELLEIITQLKAELSVSKNNTSTYRRKRISVYESRPSSMIMGGVACTIMSVLICGIVVPDIITLLVFLFKLYALESPFFLSNSTGNWSEGESYCLEHNGRFVTIDTQGKYDRILDLDNNDILSTEVFIGLSTTSTNCTDYIWSSGKPLVWSKWQVGGVDPEPNRCTTQQCVRLASGYFKTTNCKNMLKVLCEYVVKTPSSSTTMATTQIIKTTTLTMAATETSVTF